jgi:N-methylhydantoinase A
VSALGRQTPLDLTRAQAKKAAGPLATRSAYFKETGLVTVDVIARESLAPGAGRSGPVIVEAADTTVVVPPGWRLAVDAGGLIVLERAHA